MPKINDYATKGEMQSFRDEMRQSFRELSDVMIQSFHFVYARFDKIDERFDAVDRRFDAIDERFNTFESGVNVRFNSVNTRLDNVILDTPRLKDHNRLIKRLEIPETNN